MLADEDIQASWNEEDEEVEDRHEGLRAALQPHVPEEDAGQDVRGHQEGVPAPRLPRTQERPQEGDEEKQEEEDKSHAAGPLPQDYNLPQAIAPDKQSRQA